MLVIVLCVGLLIPQLQAAEVDVRPNTATHGSGRDIDAGDAKHTVPVYAYVGSDNGDTDTGGLSVHVYGWVWGIKEMTRSDYPQHAQPYSRLRTHLVGPRIFSGDSGESVAGIRVETGLGSSFSTSVYGGLPVSPDIDDTDEPSYPYSQFQDYFDTTHQDNNALRFLKERDKTLAIVGADTVYQGAGAVEVGVRAKRYTYDQRQEFGQYMAGLLTLNFSRDSQIGAEVGRMDGKTPENTYGLYRGYFFWQNPFDLDKTGFISGDALYVAYDAPVHGKDSSIHYSLGAGRTFLDNRLAAKLSVNYSQDPHFESDIGGVVTLQIQY